MNLLDEAIFRHWFEELITIEDALGKANYPDELAMRIQRAQQGMLEEEEEEEEEDAA